jgi:hypothetical protein
MSAPELEKISIQFLFKRLFTKYIKVEICTNEIYDIYCKNYNKNIYYENDTSEEYTRDDDLSDKNILIIAKKRDIAYIHKSNSAVDMIEITCYLKRYLDEEIIHTPVNVRELKLIYNYGIRKLILCKSKDCLKGYCKSYTLSETDRFTVYKKKNYTNKEDKIAKIIVYYTPIYEIKNLLNDFHKKVSEGWIEWDWNNTKNRSKIHLKTE